MSTIIEMPKLSDTMTTGTLVRWLKQAGDSVNPGDMLAEVETDKATMELENFEKGFLLKCFVNEGDQIAIGSPICAIGAKDEEVLFPSSSEAVGQPSIEALNPHAEQSAAPELPELLVPHDQPIGRLESPSTATRTKASPLAKRMAQAEGISLKGVQGTGPGGRIIKADVLKALCCLAQPPTTPEPLLTDGSQPPLCQASSPSLSAVGLPSAAVSLVPISNMRRTIARRLVESKTQIPHFYLEIEVYTQELSQLRTTINQHLTENSSAFGDVWVTFNDLILKATAGALQQVPAVNVSWLGENLQQHTGAHLAFGVAIDDGLLTPIIFNAEAKSVLQISQEAKQLIAKAKARKLTATEMSGSTFTVTNLGMFGISKFYGIINPPNAGILSVGASLEKPIVDPERGVCIGEVTTIGFSGDHRAIDGATGARFLQALKQLLEKPLTLLL